MLPEERRSKIVERLQKMEVCTIKELSAEFCVSRITMMRDLSALESDGVLVKIHGGAKIKKDDAPHYETRFNVRKNRNIDLKRALAVEAAPLVKEDSTIFIDSSTTGYIFAEELLKRSFSSLNIITNSPALLDSIREKHRVSLIVTGGELNTFYNMLGGLWVVDFLDRVNIDVAFISAAGISESAELTTSSMDIANILNKAIDRSTKTYVLADSTKLFKKEMINICSLARCTSLITNGNIFPEQISLLDKYIELRTAR
jgi:DeoR/GlpR family transcriptional regulator of sugar metabolism